MALFGRKTKKEETKKIRRYVGSFGTNSTDGCDTNFR